MCCKIVSDRDGAHVVSVAAGEVCPGQQAAAALLLRDVPLTPLPLVAAANHSSALSSRPITAHLQLSPAADTKLQYSYAASAAQLSVKE